MGAEGTAGGSKSLSHRRPSLEAAVAAAAATAGARLGPQFGHGELGEKAIHAAHWAEKTAPETLLEEQGAQHRTGGDAQQQATAEPGGVLQICQLLPEKDRGEAGSQHGRAPLVQFTPRPGPGLPTQPPGQPLGDLSPNHEGTHRTPESTHQGVRQQYQGPPPRPEQVESAVVLPRLRPKPQP